MKLKKKDFCKNVVRSIDLSQIKFVCAFCTANLIRFGSLAFTFTFTKSYSFFCPLINSCFLLQFFQLSLSIFYVCCFIFWFMVMFDWVLSFPLKTFQISSWIFLSFFQYSSLECFICSRFNSKFKLILTPSEGFILIAFPRLTYSKLSL